MAISANTLAQNASALMEQLDNNTIDFDSYRNSMSSIIDSSTNNEDFNNEENAEAVHTISIATRIAQGDTPKRERFQRS